MLFLTYERLTWPPVSASRPSSMCCPRIRPCMLISTMYRPSTRFCTRTQWMVSRHDRRTRATLTLRQTLTLRWTLKLGKRERI